jgi:hypothetical protein
MLESEHSTFEFNFCNALLGAIDGPVRADLRLRAGPHGHSAYTPRGGGRRAREGRGELSAVGVSGAVCWLLKCRTSQFHGMMLSLKSFSHFLNGSVLWLY